MVIVAILYGILVWVVFFKMKWIRWGWLSGSISVAIGLFVLAVFVGLLNYLTPSGRIVVTGRVVEVTPNVSGEIMAIPVVPNVPIRAGTVLFEIDPRPFQYKVTQLDASLAAAQQQLEQLRATYEQATANVEGLTSQLAFNKKRLADVQKLTIAQAMSVFKEEDSQVQVETVNAQLQAAKAAQLNAKLALDSQINGENTTVAQIRAQLDNAKWELAQTSIRAPADGYVTILALAVGDRALQARSVLSFIVTNEITIVGMFSPNGFETIKPGTPVTLVFDTRPGRLYQARVAEIPRGVGQGQIAVSGMLAKVGSIGGAKEFPAVISIPENLDRDILRLGTPGTATVFSDKAGAIGLLAWILIWISSYTAYL